MTSKLDYLGLELKHFKWTKIITEQFKLYCNIDHLENQYKHILHSSDSQKNLIIDLLLNLGQSLEAKLEKSFETKIPNIIHTNLDYIKDLILELKKQRETRINELQSSLSLIKI